MSSREFDGMTDYNPTTERLENQIEKLQAELAAARAEDEAHAERVRQIMQCSIDARDEMLRDMRQELAAARKPLATGLRELR